MANGRTKRGDAMMRYIAPMERVIRQLEKNLNRVAHHVHVQVQVMIGQVLLGGGKIFPKYSKFL